MVKQKSNQALYAWPLILKAERGAAPKWPADPKCFLIPRENGRLVSSVPTMLKACGRSTEHVGRVLSGFKRRHPDLSAEVHKAPRRAGRKGGKDKWVATERVLRRLHAEL